MVFRKVLLPAIFEPVISASSPMPVKVEVVRHALAAGDERVAQSARLENRLRLGIELGEAVVGVQPA